MSDDTKQTLGGGQCSVEFKIPLLSSRWEFTWLPDGETLEETKVSDDTKQTLCGGQCSVEFKVPLFSRDGSTSHGYLASWNIGGDESVW